MNLQQQTDVLVIGTGAAGLALALHLADYCRVMVLSKTSLQEGASYYAQGGVAAVAAANADDSYEAHIQDTLISGRGLCQYKTVEYVVKNAKAAIDWLINIGVDFTHETTKEGVKEYHLTQEGGHTQRRIWHAADSTGKAVKETLDARVNAHPNITVIEQAIAIDLITTKNKRRCVGAYFLDEQTKQVQAIVASHVVLATGGASKAYLYCTSPVVSSGDGIAMAYRAGCRVANMEFNQFHPTCLFHPNENSFLITEALRGEGAFLRLPNGQRFMDQYDALAELAPRDIVARAIDDQMKRGGYENVFLDITHKSPEFIREKFPMIVERCLSLGIDITREWIPVVPAAHYTCGGVMTDLNAKTDLPNLYAIGEVACTGLHGANRMASNSLLECLVFAKAAGDSILSELSKSKETIEVAPWDEHRVMKSDEAIVITHNWDELRRAMWNYVGIVRTDRRLERAMSRILMLKQEIKDYYAHYKVTRDSIELRNLVLVSELIVRSAMQRKESRGLHFNSDHSKTDSRFDGVMTIL
ncbi:MAG: L-aspartate oxidase [Pseudomonadota bacterium]